MTIDPMSDQDLTAYLDGEADAASNARIRAALAKDPALAARAEALQLPIAQANDAFGALLSDAPAMPTMPALAAAPLSQQASKYLAPAALAASFVLGMAAMSFLRPSPDWIDHVAAYQVLYVEETLSGAVQESAVTTAVLARAKETMGLEMTAPPQLQGMTFKRAQMLGIDGAPLLQLAYLTAEGIPFALCITPVAEGAQAVEASMQQQLATASWVRDGLGYVLIGGADTAGVSGLAQGVLEAS